MNESLEMLCKDCDALVAFVQPMCDDASDDELMCVICGTAITLGGLLERIAA